MLNQVRWKRLAQIYLLVQEAVTQYNLMELLTLFPLLWELGVSKSAERLGCLCSRPALIQCSHATCNHAAVNRAVRSFASCSFIQALHFKLKSSPLVPACVMLNLCLCLSVYLTGPHPNPLTWLPGFILDLSYHCGLAWQSLDSD